MAAFLLLDADRNFRRAIEVALRMEGVEVRSAASAAEAAPLLASGGFDLCVVDSLLPGAEALLEQLVAAGRRVVATGPHRELLERAARRYGVPTLEKPFSAAALLELAATVGGPLRAAASGA